MELFRILMDAAEGDAGGGESSSDAGGDTLLGSGADSGGDGGETTQTASAKATTPPEWASSLPPELKADPTLARFNDVESLAKSYLESRKAIGKKGLEKPPADASQEEHDAYWKAVGRPESPDKYVKPETLPEGYELSDDAFASFAEAAHKAGLTSEQAAALVQYDAQRSIAYQESLAEAQKQTVNESFAELRKDWGLATQEKINLADNAIKKIDDTGDLMNVLKETGLANNTTVIKAFARLGEMMGESNIFGSGQPARSNTNLTPAEAEDKLHQMRSDPEKMKALNNKSHPDHKRLIMELTDITKARVINTTT